MHFESIAEKHVLSLLDFERKNKAGKGSPLVA